MPIVRNQVRTVLLVSIPLTERTRPFYYALKFLIMIGDCLHNF
nr:MAG TPA: hypothetical protein [Bacteriophage sp.]